MRRPGGGLQRAAIGWGHIPVRRPRRYERGVFAVPDQPSSTDPLAAFGPNEWLVDELYQQYLQDKESVDRAWWEFFEDYQPGEARANGEATATDTSSPATTPAPAQPAAK